MSKKKKTEQVIEKIVAKPIEKVIVKLVGGATALNLKYEGKVIKIKINEEVEVDKSLFDKTLSRYSQYKFVKV